MSRQPSNYENTTSNYSGFSSFPTVPSFPGVVPPMPPMTAVPPGFPFMPPVSGVMVNVGDDKLECLAALCRAPSDNLI